MSWITPADYQDQQLFDYRFDLILLLVFFSSIITFFYYTIKTLRVPEMRNIHNYIIYFCLFVDIILRIGCILYSILFDSNKEVEDYTLQFYLYY